MKKEEGVVPPGGAYDGEAEGHSQSSEVLVTAEKREGAAGTVKACGETVPRLEGERTKKGKNLARERSEGKKDRKTM